MAITFGTQGTTPSGTTASITGTTSVTPAAPASMATGNYIVIAVWNRPGTVIPTNPVGWRLLHTFSGGGGTEGLDAGPIRVTLFGRKKTAAWSSMPAITITSGTSAMAQAFRYTNATGYWDLATTSGADTTANTSWSVTGAANPGITAGDYVLVFTGLTSDTPTFSAQAVSATGISAWGTVTERSEPKTTQGNDIGGYVSEHPVTTGTASAAPVATATVSTGTNATGSSVMLRMREVPEADIIGYAEAAGNTATLTVDWADVAPFGTENGDVAYLTWVHSDTATTSTTPSSAGFDQTGLPSSGIASDGNVRCELWKKVCDGTETGTFSVTMTGATRNSVCFTVVRNWDHHLATAGGDTGSDAAHAAPAATPTQDDAAVIIAQGERATSGSSTTTPPAGYTSIGDVALVATAGTLNAIAYEGSEGALTGGHASGVSISPGSWTNDTAQTDVAMWTILMTPVSTTTPITGSESTAITVSETAAIFRDVQASESNSLTVSETAVNFQDKQASESNSLAVSETVSIDIPITASESNSLAVSETQATVVSQPVSDSASIALSETISLNKDIVATDSSSISISESSVVESSQPGTETTSIAISESISIVVVASASESNSLAVADTSETLVSFSASDSAALTITDASEPQKEFASTDTASLVISDTSATDVSSTAADSAAVAVNETANVVIITFIVASDSASISVADTSVSELSSTHTDTSAISISDTSETAVSSTVTDNASITISEVANIAATQPGADSAAVGVTEESSIVVNVFLSSTDSGSITITESTDVQGIGAEVATDTAAITVSESVVTNVSVDRTDSAGVTITESIALTKQIVASDSADISVSDSSSTFVTQSRTDSAAISVSEAILLAIPKTATDTAAITIDNIDTELSRPDGEDVVISLSESSNVQISGLILVTDHEEMGLPLSLSETTSTLVQISRSDSAAIGVIEAFAFAPVDQPGQDFVSVAVTEEVNLLKPIVSSETVSVTISESIDLFKRENIEEIESTDSLGIGVKDRSKNIWKSGENRGNIVFDPNSQHGTIISTTGDGQKFITTSDDRG